LSPKTPDERILTKKQLLPQEEIGNSKQWINEEAEWGEHLKPPPKKQL
jgi:hypothetical protein